MKHPPYDETTERAWEAWVKEFVASLKQIASTVKASELYWNDRFDGPRCEKHSGKNCRCDRVYPEGQDDQRFCEKCGCILQHFFSDHGKDDTIAWSAYETSGPITPEEAFSLVNVLDADVPGYTVRWPRMDFNPGPRDALRIIAQRLEAT